MDFYPLLKIKYLKIYYNASLKFEVFEAELFTIQL